MWSQENPQINREQSENPQKQEKIKNQITMEHLNIASSIFKNDPTILKQRIKKTLTHSQC